MLESIIDFFNTSLATVTIYDILVTILFALALIITIASGLVILSAKVKKTNLEIEKNKNIQFINEKIIQNRLDLILNKIRSTENYLKDNLSTRLPGITNNNIKSSIIENEQSDQYEQSDQKIESKNLASEVLSIPYMNSSDLEEKVESKTNEEDLGAEETTEEKDNDNNSIITYDTEKTNDKNNFDDGQSIPIKIVANHEIINNKKPTLEEKASLETNSATLEQNAEINENITKDLIKANEFLNNMDAFTNDDKFNITENIKDDGTCIKCFVRNEYYHLTYKELIRQLLIQNLVNHYNYPLRMISVNYRLSRSIDVAVIKNHTPYIIVLIDNPNKPKRIQLLKDLTLASNAKFAIWCNGQIITCYSMNNGYLEEIYDIPNYEEISNYTHNNASSYKKDRNNVSFYKDTNNIYRKNNYYSTDTTKNNKNNTIPSALASKAYLESIRSSEVDNSYNVSEYFSKYPYGPINNQKPSYRTKIGGSYTGSNLGYLNYSTSRNKNSDNNFSFVNRMR